MFWNELTSGLVHTWSLPAQFAEAGVVDAEVVGDLMDDGAGAGGGGAGEDYVILLREAAWWLGRRDGRGRG